LTQIHSLISFLLRSNFAPFSNLNLKTSVFPPSQIPHSLHPCQNNFPTISYFNLSTIHHHLQVFHFSTSLSPFHFNFRLVSMFYVFQITPCDSRFISIILSIIDLIKLKFGLTQTSMSCELFFLRSLL
jgi:hypothetical protein